MTAKRHKIPKAEFLALFKVDRPVIPGDPNRLTKATKKDHVHTVGKQFRSHPGRYTPADYRMLSKKRNRLLNQKRKEQRNHAKENKAS